MRLVQRLRKFLSFQRGSSGAQEPAEEEISPSAPGFENRIDNIIYVDRWRAMPSTSSEERRSYGTSGLAIAAIVAVTMVAGAFVHVGTKQATTDGTIATAAGESQTKTLRDGTVISVKPNSRVLLDAYESERRVDFVEGEAVFTAAPVPNSQLVVSTHFARVSTVDATFRVALDRGMTVEVYEGQVDVAVPGMRAVTVTKGKRFRVIAERSDSVVAQERGGEVLLGSMTRATS